jgi:thiaminase/transcriptional activator TenA
VTLSARLWDGIAPTYDAILRHPFVLGLTDGTLDAASFAYYLAQDAHYLLDFARALAVVGAKARGGADTAMFARHAAGTLEVERALHETLLPTLGIDAAARTPVAPTNRAYTSYLLAVAYGGSFADGLAAVLPCYWIYHRVGAHLLEQGSPDPRYQRWIDTYAGAEFAAVVADVLDCTDRLEVSPAQEARMHEHFGAAARYEWMFWDMALRREEWPLA